MSPGVLRFDRYELQLSERRLLRDGQVVALRAKAFDVLVVLARNVGRLVTRNDLLEGVWPGLVVEEGNVAAQIAALRRVLAADLIVTVPGFGYRLQAHSTQHEGSNGMPGPVAAPGGESTAPPNVPWPLRLIGRDEELSRLMRCIAEPGCVTLVGPGGVGKTALARALRESCAAPSAWVDLADVDDARQTLPAIGRAIGQPQLADHAAASLGHGLRALDLLVLDNAERVADAIAAQVPALLAAAPSLCILVTSQMPLAIRGERVERIEPLLRAATDIPDTDAMNIGALALFVQRIREADPRFRFTDDALPQLRRLCEQLDGLPLVLEMAAARVPLLGLQRVEEALAARFALLRTARRDAPARHRTLHAALDWSYRLLDPRARRIFRTLGVFVGGFTADLGARVAGDIDEGYWDTVDRLSILVDRSLVSSNHDDPPRYHLLETMRAFAIEQLEAAGETDAMRARHAAALDELLAGAADEPDIADHEARRRFAVAEMANVREAITWAMRHDAPLALRLSARAAEVAVLSVWRSEARDWLVACAPLAERDDIDIRWRAIWWANHAKQQMHSSGVGAPEAARRAVDLCVAAHDEWSLAQSLMTLAWTGHFPDTEVRRALADATALCDRHPQWPPRLRCRLIGTEARVHEIVPDFPAALDAYRRQATHARASGMSEAASLASINVANMRRQLGLGEQALQTLARCAAEQVDPAGYVAVFSRVLGMRILFELGRFDEALAQLEPVLAAARRIGIASALEVAALGLAQAGRPRAAAILVGHIERSFAERGLQLWDAPHCDVPRARKLVGESLDPTSIAALVQEGRGIPDGDIDALFLLAADRPT
jgi:predicted ATPase/DNA-binding winged helix-turn-helix (wHTH) protein